MQTIAPINWIKLAILGVIWGASFMFVTIALEGTGPLFLVATRLCLGAAFLLMIIRAKGVSLPARKGENAGKIWVFILCMALLSNALPFALLSWAQESVASGFAGVCMAVVPLFVLPLAHFLVPGEAMKLRRFIGFVIGSIGVMVLIGPAAFNSTGNELETLARLACVGAACCYALGSICTRLCPDVDRWSLAAATLVVAALIFTPYALIAEGLPQNLTATSVLALLYLGIFPTGVAQILLVQVIRDAGPVFMSLVNYQVPIWSIVFGAVVLLEPLPPSLLLGMGLILGGVALSQLGALRRLFGRGRKTGFIE
ncbi:DMT family transporter [Roseovarius albus]|nr:DMT family transporter [Roseovarius albus]